eukprot:CAMPEP_0114362562 /NCGR_PEP_ID=MMETSP0101-20121206/25756_1 /TAXON_ID=38822 ORGANISM="Pteridomonas danica, Strain PT" /NCGR_SAMPLE_ID=MMETSP0101 /ASSEMBLY_ACC=CAM_ASM_000211 /LENGTH=378 /DNA_ID=CAMNT_0001508459 /DNA_START=249 /DNA_END=1381 /DNA_ORIENTATION=-
MSPTSFPAPTMIPIPAPTTLPTMMPIPVPTSVPLPAPSLVPIPAPSKDPTPLPSPYPTNTFAPTEGTPFPTLTPTSEPTASPTLPPTSLPTPEPTSEPTYYPTSTPSTDPTPTPTSLPSSIPTPSPTLSPTPLPTQKPQPEVTVVSPDPLWLSENGVNSSSFTITLVTEPLSKVWLSFSSRFGDVSFDPSGITFDYNNFSDVVSVAVYAVDDDIDQGKWHGDSILTSVTSYDSWFECDEVVGRVCGQAAVYGNYTGVSPMNVTIKDDDVAGVTLSTTFSNATYDNYGDALTDASYTIVLTSEPTETVTVTLSGLGSYSSPSDATVSFTAADWDTPVTVTVSCDASTTDRPVCASGNRFCAALDGRTETVAHTVSSSDS